MTLLYWLIIPSVLLMLAFLGAVLLGGGLTNDDEYEDS